ncbi:helix-turn-helix domain-containing protein [Streptomyces sp. IBSNAI002]|uniref:helix-turn-helix domain-containing protein n=1 Tax=Streptomyces sp. IBSNAI002 TaxID=3457500 RepID=UPI003FD27700
MTQRVEGLPAPKERRRLREAAELTPEQVASAMGVTTSTVRSWESGRTHPRGRKRELYVDFLAGLAPRPDAPRGAAAAVAAVAGGADPGPARRAIATAPEETRAAARPEPTAPAGAAPPAEESTAMAEPAPAAEAETEAAAEPPAAAPPRPRGPAEAFDALYALAAPGLARQTYLLTGRRRLALESVERAFRQAWAQWPDVAADPDPVGWVRAAAYEYALSPWHRFRRAHRHPDKPPAEPADRILLDAMLALPTIHRRTVLLYDGVGLDLPDTAAETEASTPATGNRLLNAHADLAHRIPELAGVPPEEQSALLRDLFDALRPAVVLDPRPASAVRGHGERRTRQWTRATLSLTAVIAAATAYTASTAPTHYEPPRAPGESVSGVPPLSGPQQLTDRSRLLHEKLRADPDAGPARVVPRID